MPRPFSTQKLFTPPLPPTFQRCRARARAGLTALAVAAVASMVVSVALQSPLRAASALLETVKQNPGLAKNLCRQFKALNARGKSATSKEAIAMVASSQNLSPVDAEVLATYVIGLHCPDVR
ncbi:MAG TPA: hypothetical protein VER57_07700 [Cyanobium sp.]|nr:hypothetical protein [Cyanobium sp.]